MRFYVTEKGQELRKELFYDNIAEANEKAEEDYKNSMGNTRRQPFGLTTPGFNPALNESKTSFQSFQPAVNI